MKRILTVLIASILLVAALATGCAKEEDAPIIKIATLAGPTGMGMAKIIDESEGKYEVSILTSPDQIIPKVISKEVDICAVPSNLASVLYAKTDKEIVVLSINTTGVLYIVENGDTISTIEDLRGKTIYASGQGASPEYILNHIFEENGLVPNVDVTIVYEPEHATLANKVAAGEISIAILPEPFVSVVTAKNTDVKVKIDINAEWEAIHGEGAKMPMGVAIVQKSFLESYPEAVEAFMTEYEASVNFVNSNMESAAELIAQQGILPSAGIAKTALPRSGISFIVGDELQEVLGQYLEVLNGYNPASVGGALPDDDFYYKK